MKKEKGITLVALIATVIIMLILLTVTVTISINNGGLIGKSRQAKEEARALEVDKAKELWLMGVEEDEEDEVNEEYKTLDELLKELKEKELLTDEEIDKINSSEKKSITIGGRTITFSRDE